MLYRILRIIKNEGLGKFLTAYVMIELRHVFIDSLLLHSYSQNREDLAISEFFSGKKAGSYIDVGANDPTRFSNTKKLYDMGWKGVNVEPNTTKYHKLCAQRPRDININAAINNSPSNKATLYIFELDTLTTLSVIEKNYYITKGYRHINTVTIPTKKLSTVYKEHKSFLGKVDLLSIDTEGSDLEVITSVDFNELKPKLICVESCLKRDIETSNHKNTELIRGVLESNGYTLYKKTNLNSLYQLRVRNQQC